MTLNIYLPRKYEGIGWGLIIAHAAILIILAAMDHLGLLAESLYETGYLIRMLFRYTLMVGLLFVICSKEEIEDELVQQIRLKAFQQGLFITVGLSLFMFLITLIIQYPLVYESAEGILATLIFIVIIYKYHMYRHKNDKV